MFPGPLETVSALAFVVTQAKRYHRFLMNHEEAVIKAFFLPTKRERYLGFIATAKGRAKIIRELSHFKALDPQFMRSIIPSQHDAGSVAKLIRSKGAGPSCRVISENSDLGARYVVPSSFRMNRSNSLTSTPFQSMHLLS